MNVVGVRWQIQPPRAKKAKRSAPVCLASAEEHVNSSRKTVLLTVTCCSADLEQSIDFSRVNTVKDTKSARNIAPFV